MTGRAEKAEKAGKKGQQEGQEGQEKGPAAEGTPAVGNVQTVAVDPGALPWRERWSGRLALGAARLLAGRSPARICAVLRRVRAGARPATYEEAGRARAVVSGSSFVTGAAKGCLTRSLATVLLCRLSGVFPSWCVGVRVMPPFGAHAWVVAEGRDVDEPYPSGYHSVLLRVDPEQAKQAKQKKGRKEWKKRGKRKGQEGGAGP